MCFLRKPSKRYERRTSSVQSVEKGELLCVIDNNNNNDVMCVLTIYTLLFSAVS